MSAAGEQKTFPWRRIMGLGLGVLRIAPIQFWSMTPRELEAALYGFHGVDNDQCLARSGMNDLVKQFPDEVTNG